MKPNPQRPGRSFGSWLPLAKIRVSSVSNGASTNEGRAVLCGEATLREATLPRSRLVCRVTIITRGSADATTSRDSIDYQMVPPFLSVTHR